MRKINGEAPDDLQRKRDRDFAGSIARLLDVPLGKSTTSAFRTAKISVCSVRGREVFIVQPTSPPVNDHLVGTASDYRRLPKVGGATNYRGRAVFWILMVDKMARGASPLPRAW